MLLLCPDQRRNKLTLYSQDSSLMPKASVQEADAQVCLTLFLLALVETLLTVEGRR